VRVTGGAIMAEFASADALVEAVGALVNARYGALETYAPFDIPELDAALHRPRSRIPMLVFLGGLAGLVLAYGIQWFADVVDYPLDVGGRPLHAVPAFIPSTFEGTVLGAALVAFFGLLWILRLPELWAPEFEVDGFERATIDRFWVRVGSIQSQLDAANAERLLRGAGAIRIVSAEDAA
jgi:hypothetical protein